ncbi:hypothetical protein SK128_011849 [Halocaridina rubra]|uniref:C2H2-type domain-containing protein n=1 Tax=Halocaridina rubra TaxID=373956 RepID=A0AAN8XHA2_HALRR
MGVTRAEVSPSSSEAGNEEPAVDLSGIGSCGLHLRGNPDVAVTTQGKHQCQICWRLFTERNNLHRHMRIHTGFKPYFCPLCPYQSNRNGNLVRHMAFRHGKHP